MLQRKKNLDQVGQCLTLLESSIDVNRALRHQDLNIELELFFRDVLNLVFGIKLANAETEASINQDSFDLFDDQNKIAVQVTTTISATKIRKTLGTFIGRHDKKYDRLVFMYPTLRLGPSKADFSKLLKGFDFDSKRDRWSFSTILKRIQDMRIEEQGAVLNLLEREITPLIFPEGSTDQHPSPTVSGESGSGSAPSLEHSKSAKGRADWSNSNPGKRARSLFGEYIAGEYKTKQIVEIFESHGFEVEQGYRHRRRDLVDAYYDKIDGSAADTSERLLLLFATVMQELNSECERRKGPSGAGHRLSFKRLLASLRDAGLEFNADAANLSHAIILKQ